jgi:hypothetical protein
MWVFGDGVLAWYVVAWYGKREGMMEVGWVG